MHLLTVMVSIAADYVSHGKTHNPHRTTIHLPPRWLFQQMQTIQPEGMWCHRWVNQNMWSVTSTPLISIGHHPTPNRHLQPRGLGPATLSSRQRLYGHTTTTSILMPFSLLKAVVSLVWSSSVKHQTDKSYRSGFRAYLPSSGWHTNKYLTNDDHICRLYIRRTSDCYGEHRRGLCLTR